MLSGDLKIEQLKVNIGEQEIIKGLNLKVFENSFVALLGPNGSGKSTLLRSIYRVIPPTSGSILLNNKLLAQHTSREVAREMSVVSQFQNNNFDFSVEEVVMTGRSPHLSPMQKEGIEDNKIVEEALKLVGLSALKNRSVSQLSGGEKQRVALARAIAQKPKIMILDEPSNHLDIRYQMEILSLLKGLGINVLAALHDLTLAAQFCDYIYLLKEGEVCYEGIPDEVITEQNIKEIYGLDSEVFRHPKTGALNISYYPINN